MPNPYMYPPPMSNIYSSPYKPKPQVFRTS